MVALAPTMMTISGSTFHHLLIILSINGLCFSVFLVIASIIWFSIIIVCEFHELYC